MLNRFELIGCEYSILDDSLLRLYRMSSTQLGIYYALGAMWFEQLTGFQEESLEQVRNNLSVNGDMLTSHVNGKEYICGLRESTIAYQAMTGQVLLL